MVWCQFQSVYQMKRPPILAHDFLKWFAGKADIEDIQGDLDEVYGLKRQTSGKLTCGLWYWLQVVNLLFSYGLKKRISKSSYSPFYHKNSITMLKNYLKIAYRNLKKQRTFTAINVLGLSIGMSVALLALAMYIDLKQFDTYHENAENIYRVLTKTVYAGDVERYGSAPPALTYQMKEEIPGINESVHINTSLHVLLNHRGNAVRTNGYFTEPSFFDMFSFELATGSPEALMDPGKVILTKEFANKLYGEESALGKTLETEKYGQLQVAGILKDFPKRTHLAFDMLVGFPHAQKFNSTYHYARA